MYPSIQWDPAADAVKDSIKESKVFIKNVNIEEMRRYISVAASDDDIEKENLREVLPLPKRKTNIRTLGQRYANHSQMFTPANREPNETENKSIVALAAKVATLACLSKHYYRFGGKILRQIKGG